MKRKDFFKKVSQGTLACGGMMMLPARVKQEKEAETDQGKKAREFEKRFKESWVLTLMENMEKSLDEKTRVGLMEQCGRACARRGGLYKLAESCRGDIEKFVQTMAKQLGEENASIKGNLIQWRYPRCYCELVAEGPAKLPATYCFCSVGWVREMFELVAQKPVKVELRQSVKRGDPACLFLIQV